MTLPLKIGSPPILSVIVHFEKSEHAGVHQVLLKVPFNVSFIIIKNQKVDYEGLHIKEPWGTFKEDDYLNNRPGSAMALPILLS